MINDDVSVPINPITEDITKSNTKLEPVLGNFFYIILQTFLYSK